MILQRKIAFASSRISPARARLSGWSLSFTCRGAASSSRLSSDMACTCSGFLFNVFKLVHRPSKGRFRLSKRTMGLRSTRGLRPAGQDRREVNGPTGEQVQSSDRRREVCSVCRVLQAAMRALSMNGSAVASQEIIRIAVVSRARASAIWSPSAALREQPPSSGRFPRALCGEFRGPAASVAMLPTMSA